MMRRRQAGFTLIEILVVITIIATLMGLVVLLVPKATDAQYTSQTAERIGALQMALTKFKDPKLLGMYPAATLSDLKDFNGKDVGKTLGAMNDINQGAEALYVMLFLPGHSVNVDYDDTWFGNTDGDDMACNPTIVEGENALQLREMVDRWGNPIAYFSAREFKNPKAVSSYIMADGREVEVKPWRSEVTGRPFGEGKYQIFSAGPDQEFGTDDDITSW